MNTASTTQDPQAAPAPAVGVTARGARAVARERAACVLRLPPGACPMASGSESHFLPLVWDEGYPWMPLVPGIQWLSARQVIARACAIRAVQTVDGQLTVRGILNMTPERYVRHWRERLAQCLAVDQAPHLLGMRPVARLEIDPRAISLARSPWHEPAGGLAGLLERYPGTLAPPTKGAGDPVAVREPKVAQRLALAVDLTTRHGACDAWWLQEYLRSSDRNPHPLQAWVDCRPKSQAAMPAEVQASGPADADCPAQAGELQRECAR